MILISHIFYFICEFIKPIYNTNGIANIYNKFIKVTSKLHKTSSSTGFIKKALQHDVAQRFAKIRGQLLNNKNQLDAERKLMISHIARHDLKLKEITSKHRTLGQELVK